MPRSDFSIEDSHTDLATILEQHLRAGFQPDLALDLVLNELVIRAAEATHANSAALALVRGEELVCRAATGNFAPDLGVPLNPREGLSGVCLRTREPQLSVDTEIDPRVAVAFSRRFGIRSVLAVPVFDANDPSQFAGVLEVFSPTPAAFSRADQRVLEAFSSECARVRRTALELSKRPQEVEKSAFEVAAPRNSSAAPAIDVSWLSIPVLAPRILPVPEALEPETASAREEASEIAANADPMAAGIFEPETFEQESLDSEGFDSKGLDSETSDFASGEETTSEAGTSVGSSADPSVDRSFDRKMPEIAVPEFLKFVPTPPRPSRYEAWSLLLGTLAIFSIIAVSFLIGSRIGWLRATESTAPSPPRPAAVTPPPAPENIAIETGPVGAEAPKPKSKSVRREAKAATPEKADADSNNGDLVVYEKGKVVFRIKNPPAEQAAQLESGSNSGGEASLAASATAPEPPVAAPVPTKTGPTRSVWLNPTDAEDRLVTRIEPDYPMAARRAHRAGDVVLEVDVAEDGSVASVRTLRGDPVLAAAASQAVRNWRYQPYLLHDHPSEFHTDVTVSFATSN